MWDDESASGISFEGFNGELPPELLLNLFLSHAPVMLWAVDVQGVSRGGGLRSLGLRPGSRIGESVFEVYRSYPDILERHRQALSGEHTTSVLRTGDRSFQMHLTPLRNGRGEVTGVLGSAFDVTARRRSEDDLRERNRALSAVYAVDRATAEVLAP